MPIRTSGTVEVPELNEFRRALKQLDNDYAKQLGKINQDVAQSVVDEATTLGEAEGGSYLAALRLRGLRASKAQTAASIVLDGAKAPMIFGAEFGAKRFSQFEPWRGAGDDAGYALWPAIRAKQPDTEEAYLEALDELSSRAFPD